MEPKTKSGIWSGSEAATGRTLPAGSEKRTGHKSGFAGDMRQRGLAIIAMQDMCDASRRGDIQVMQRLLKEGTHVDALGAELWSRTPLQTACTAGRMESVQFLLSMGASIDKKDNAGATAMTFAICHGHKDIVMLLISQGADAGGFTAYSKTPLMYACDKGKFEIARLLLDHGVDPNARNVFGQTALAIAESHGDGGMMELLLAYGAK